MDEIDYSFRDNPDAPSEQVLRVKRLACEYFDVPNSQTHLCINYTSESQPTPAINRAALALLAASVQSARHYCLKQTLKDHNKGWQTVIAYAHHHHNVALAVVALVAYLLLRVLVWLLL